MLLNQSPLKIVWAVPVLSVLAACLPGMLLAQAETVKAAIPVIEPGLEQAVKWQWQVEPSAAADWGIPIDLPPGAVVNLGDPATAKTTAHAAPPAKVIPNGPPAVMTEYVVVKGDSLTVIARAHGVTVDQLRIFNAMKHDRILIGQVVKVPGVNDIKAMIATAAAAEKAATNATQGPAKETPRSASKTKAKKAPTPAREMAPVLIATKPHRALPPAAWGASPLVRIQTYLDRQGFSIGPIDGMAGPMYDAAYTAFEAAHPGELHTPEGQPSAAMKAIGGPYAEYTLTAADMRWISLPSSSTGSTRSTSGKSKHQAVEPLPTLDELTQASFLAYRSGWEFVAERFHAAESFLRHINPGLKHPNAPGAVFLVPNVLPFEIETALAPPLQPAADPAAPITASMVGLRRLVIRRGAVVIATMPVAAARPGLHGRKIWRILEAIPRPRLTSTGTAAAPLPAPLTLAAGPNNPVGIVWINLAKGGDSRPLPYGLHGTSIPGSMTHQESLGGFRLANWDIARAVRLLPAGTELKWEPRDRGSP